MGNDLFSRPEVVATFGTIGEFQAEEKYWTRYVEQMQHYFTANDIMSAEKQRSLIFSVCGVPTYELTSTLFASKKLGDVTFLEMIKPTNNTGITGRQ